MHKSLKRQIHHNINPFTLQIKDKQINQLYQKTEL